MQFNYTPPTKAELCVQYLPFVPDMQAWADLCVSATLAEGAEPMLHASRMRIRVGHHPDVRKIMRHSAESHITWLQLKSRI